MSKIVRVYPDSDLRCGHTGLAAACKDAQKQLKMGNFIMFLNRSQTAFKLLAPNDVLVYYRSSARRRVVLMALSFPTTRRSTWL